jgi:very-short-patch-repair endonuclease
MDALSLVRARGGVMHRSSLRDAGFSPYRVRRELEAGRLISIGRDRVALPQLQPDIVRAARAGLRLTCVTEARRRGLWAFADSALHVAAPDGYSARGRLESDFEVHWSLGPSHVPREWGVEPLPNVLYHVARCQPLDYAVATFDSALNGHAISVHELNRLAKRLGRRFASVVAATDGRADSGSESLFRVRMSAAGVQVEPQAVVDGHPVDGLIGKTLVVQIDGFGPHSDPARRARDLAQDRRLDLLGFTVFRFSSLSIEREWPTVERQILDAMAQGIHDQF